MPLSSWQFALTRTAADPLTHSIGDLSGSDLNAAAAAEAPCTITAAPPGDTLSAGSTGTLASPMDSDRPRIDCFLSLLRPDAGSPQGASRYDFHKIFGFFDPLSPVFGTDF